MPRRHMREKKMNRSHALHAHANGAGALFAIRIMIPFFNNLLARGFHVKNVSGGDSRLLSM